MRGKPCIFHLLIILNSMTFVFSTHTCIIRLEDIYMFTMAQPMHSWKTIMPANKPRWVRFIGSAPLETAFAGKLALVPGTPGALEPRARPRQLAMLKKISMLP